LKSAREMAYEILVEVYLKDAYANLSLKKNLALVSPQDQSLCTSLVYTTLQNQITIRAVWLKEVKTQPKAKVAVLLDLAVSQMRYFDKLPIYAIIHESVELAHQVAPYAASMVNAVLRKLVDHAKVEIVCENQEESFALNHAIPNWLYKMWIAHYGKETAQKIAISLLEPAKLCYHVNTLKKSTNDFLSIEGIQRSALADDVILSKENLIHSDWIKNAYLYPQDEASAFVAEFSQVKPNLNVLDVCSAPGSKTASLALLMKNTGHIDAFDLHPHRIELVESLMARLGVTNVEARVADATQLDQTLNHQSYDLILADVPCSGLGVLRRKADIKLRLQPKDIDEVIKVQADILESISDLCKVEGTIVYSTCTLNKKENEQQISMFLKKHPNYILVQEETIFPFTYDSDGFYMAKLKRLA
jgi:16S rRNA (cytosine967-C5)-methyltransferase